MLLAKLPLPLASQTEARLEIAVYPTDEKGNPLFEEENEASLEIRLFRPGRP